MSHDTLGKLSLNTMIEHIARGHAYTKHVLGEDPKAKMAGLNAFTETHDNNGNELGPDLGVRTVLDLRHYIQSFIDDEDTTGFVKSNDGAIVLFNSRDRVMVHFTPNDKQHDYGSVYRYDTSPKDFERMHDNELYEPPVSRRHMYRIMNNYRYPGSVRQSLEDLVAGIQTDPMMYTARPETHLSEARFLAALANEFRPGRKDVQDAGNNGILHSPQYAEKHQRNIFGPASVTRDGMDVDLSQYEYTDDDFEMATLLRERMESDDDPSAYDFESDQPGMM